MQLGAVALAAAHIPLAAEYPQPAEFQAVQIMLAAQITWATMLFPVLLVNWRAVVAAAGCACVMLAIAGMLSAWSLAQIVIPAGFVTLWIITLGVWPAALPNGRSRMIASGLATTYAVGGALVWYLANDLSTESGRPVEAAFGPLLIAVTSPQHPPGSGWIILIVLLIGGSAVNLARSSRRR